MMAQPPKARLIRYTNWNVFLYATLAASATASMMVGVMPGTARRAASDLEASALSNSGTADCANPEDTAAGMICAGSSVVALLVNYAKSVDRILMGTSNC